MILTHNIPEWALFVFAVGIPILPLIGLGATAIGSLFGKKDQGRRTFSNQGTTSGTTTQGPLQLGSEYAGLQNAIMPMIMKRLSSPSSLPRGFAENRIAGINRTHDLAKQSVGNNITARGLGSSPIAGAADTRSEMGRISDIVGFQNTIPTLERQMQNEDLGAAMGMLDFGRSLAGRTTTTSGTSNMSGTEQAGGTGTGMVGNLSSMLGWMIGNGMFGKKGMPPLPEVWQGPPNPSWGG